MLPLVASYTPYEMLREIERRSLALDAELPKEEKRKATWNGVAFVLDRNLLLAPLHDVQEVLDCPPLTMVPRTKSWLRGVANVRGRLLPVIDLNVYLGGGATPLRGSNRILIVQYGVLSAGLLVDEVLGQRHFLDEDRCPLPTLEAGGVMDYVRPSAYHKDGDVWLVFDMHKLVASQQFLQAAE
ncbi:MAG: chemotaxis protein CheW [Gammaproteobacteria bacterium]